MKHSDQWDVTNIGNVWGEQNIQGQWAWIIIIKLHGKPTER